MVIAHIKAQEDESKNNPAKNRFLNMCINQYA